MAYDNPDGIIAMSLILWMVACGAITLRFMSRRRTDAGTGLDDWLIIGALFFLTGLAIIEVYACGNRIWAVPLGGNISTDPVGMHRLKIAKYLEQPMLLLGVTALWMVKISVVALYRRIFKSSQAFRIVSLVWMFLLSAWGLGFIIAGLAQCGSHYMALFGTPKQYLKYCGTTFNLAGYAIVVTDIVTDLVTIMLPLPMIYKLHCSITRKLQLAAIFAVGLLSLAASCTRAFIIVKATQDLYYMDVITLYTSVSVWNYVEIVVGIVAACAITYRPILADIRSLPSFQSLVSSRKSRKSSGVSTEKTESAGSATQAGSTGSTDKLFVVKVYQVRQDPDLESGLYGGNGRQLVDATQSPDCSQ